MSTDQQPVASVALMEAVDYVLNQAPCDCPHKMRFERGEHMSGCYLFDLNVEYASTQIAQPAAQAEPPNDGGPWCVQCGGVVEAAQAEPVAWQPIETAPKDGTQVLLFEPRPDWFGPGGGWSGVAMAAWETTDYLDSRDQISSRVYEWVVHNVNAGEYILTVDAPTHWMPLPSAPKSGAHD